MPHRVSFTLTGQQQCEMMLGFKQRRDRSVVTRYRWLADFFWDRKITRAGDGINIVSGTDELEGSTFREDANSNAT